MKKPFTVALAVAFLFLAGAVLFVFAAFSNLFGYVAFGCGALSIFFFLRLFNATRSYGLPIAALVGIVLCFKYHSMLQNMTNSELASFFKTGTRCTNAASIVSGTATIKYIMLESEGVCYVSALKETLNQISLNERPSYILQAASHFQAQQRMTPTILTLLSALAVMNRSKEKTQAADPSQKVDATAGLYTDLISLMEIYPLPTEMKLTDPDAMKMEKMAKEIEHKVILTLVIKTKTGVDGLRRNFIARMPAAAIPSPVPPPPTFQGANGNPPDPYEALQTRIVAIQKNWNLSDQDLLTGQK